MHYWTWLVILHVLSRTECWSQFSRVNLTKKYVWNVQRTAMRLHRNLGVSLLIYVGMFILAHLPWDCWLSQLTSRNKARQYDYKYFLILSSHPCVASAVRCVTLRSTTRAVVALDELRRSEVSVLGVANSGRTVTFSHQAKKKVGLRSFPTAKHKSLRHLSGVFTVSRSHLSTENL